MDPKYRQSYPIHVHDSRNLFEGYFIICASETLIDSADYPFYLWNMFIIGADVQNDVIFITIIAEWFELRIHIDGRRIETLHHIGLIDCVYSLDQNRNATIFKTFNSTELQV